MQAFGKPYFSVRPDFVRWLEAQKRPFINLGNYFAEIKKRMLSGDTPLVLVIHRGNYYQIIDIKTVDQAVTIFNEALEQDLEDLSSNFDGANWNEQKVGESIHHWHGTAIRSTAIKPARKYEVDAQGNPTFSEIKEEYREKYRTMYEESKPYYDLLMQEKEYFL